MTFCRRGPQGRYVDANVRAGLSIWGRLRRLTETSGGTRGCHVNRVLGNLCEIASWSVDSALTTLKNPPIVDEVICGFFFDEVIELDAMWVGHDWAGKIGDGVADVYPRACAHREMRPRSTFNTLNELLNRLL